MECDTTARRENRDLGAREENTMPETLVPRASRETECLVAEDRQRPLLPVHLTTLIPFGLRLPDCAQTFPRRTKLCIVPVKDIISTVS